MEIECSCWCTLYRKERMAWGSTSVIIYSTVRGQDLFHQQFSGIDRTNQRELIWLCHWLFQYRRCSRRALANANAYMYICLPSISHGQLKNVRKKRQQVPCDYLGWLAVIFKRRDFYRVYNKCYRKIRWVSVFSLFFLTPSLLMPFDYVCPGNRTIE